MIAIDNIKGPEDYASFAARAIAEAERRQAAMKHFIASQPASVPCRKHPECNLSISFDRTCRLTVDNGGVHTAGYDLCPQCVALQEEERIQKRLARQGVGLILWGATFESWTPQSKADAENLVKVREFANGGKGFLLLLGSVGTGKSHLAVACMRGYKDAVFITQNRLLGELRDTYGNNHAADPISRCKRTALLVLDEVGLSVGGKDEAAMLYEILNHRHAEKKPTIITSNLLWPELQDVLGSRLADRLRESAFSIITFGGKSQRGEARTKYFGERD